MHNINIKNIKKEKPDGLNGENCLTKKEVEFLHDKGIKIVPIYHSDDDKKTEEQGNQSQAICD